MQIIWYSTVCKLPRCRFGEICSSQLTQTRLFAICWYAYPIKSYDFLVRSIGLVDSKIRPRLVIVSNFRDDKEFFYIQDIAENLGVSIEFKTLISEKELVELYNRALFTVYAPVMESFRLVPLESMACGTPVIGICEGGVRETVKDGLTGFLIDRDPKLFANAIVKLLGDKSLLNEFGVNARSYVKNLGCGKKQ